MKNNLTYFLKLNLGLLLYALGMVVGYEAQVGYAPWEVFHVGLAKVLSLSIGQANIIVGLIILAFLAYKKEAIGLGSLLNMVLVGIFFDLILYTGLIPKVDTILMSMVYVLLAMIIIAFATYYYVSAGYGAGPRDGLIFYLSRELKFSIGSSRRIIEVLVTLLGYFMGGQVGIGTLIFAFVTGYIMEYIFKLLGFSPSSIKQRTFKRQIG